MSSHYETLNVTRGAEDVVIESAYRALMKRYHPDKTNGDPAAAERAKAINAAYSTLRDPESRARYDRTLGQEAPPRRPEPRPQPKPQPAPQPQAARPAEPTARHDPAPPAGSAPRSGLVSAAFIGLAVLIGIGALGSLFGGGPSASTGTDSATTSEAGNEAATVASQPAPSRANERGEERRRSLPENRSEPESVAPVQDSEGAPKSGASDAPLIKEETDAPPPPKDLEGLY